MDSITIPKTIKAATERLNGLGALLTAKEWERAAIVYAFTEPIVGNQARRTAGLSIEGLARLGITGLRSDNSVRAYRAAWKIAIDDGQAQPVQPGDSVVLPARDWPPTGNEALNSVRTFRQKLIEEPTATIGKIIQGEPEAIVALAQAVRETPAVLALVQRVELDAVRQMLVREHLPPTDYSESLRTGVNRLMEVMRAMREDRWTPDPTERTLLAMLAHAFGDMGGGTTPADSLFDEIGQFLEGARP